MVLAEHIARHNKGMDNGIIQWEELDNTKNLWTANSVHQRTTPRYDKQEVRARQERCQAAAKEVRQ